MPNDNRQDILGHLACGGHIERTVGGEHNLVTRKTVHSRDEWARLDKETVEQMFEDHLLEPMAQAAWRLSPKGWTIALGRDGV